MRRPVSWCQMRVRSWIEFHRRQRLDAKLRIDPAAREIVQNMDLVTLIRQMKRGRPTNETVTTENSNLHSNRPLLTGSNCLASDCDSNSIARRLIGHGFPERFSLNGIDEPL